jgi:hypothetical protein
VKRETWVARTATFTEDEAERTREIIRALNRDKGVYRRQFRS